VACRSTLRWVWLFCSVAFGADAAPLDIKMGLWESTTTMERCRTPPIPPELLERLTPEQRAKIEEHAKAQQGAKTTTRKHCIKKRTSTEPWHLATTTRPVTARFWPRPAADWI
jgi:hypothetical protein